MGPVFGLYTHIRANRIRSVILLALLWVLIYIMAYGVALFIEAMTHNYALQTLLDLAWRDVARASPVVTVAAIAWVLIGFATNRAIVDAVTGAKGIARTDNPRVYTLLENLCISRGIPTPRIEVMDDPALNAFASGLTEKQYTVTVTTALLETLDDEELEAVLAHELTHIRNEDVRMMVIAVVIAGILSFIAELFFRVLSRMRWSGGSSDSSDRDKGSGGAFAAIVIASAMIVVAWLLSSVIRFALSRRREFLADAGAVELTKNPDAMIRALMKISGRGEIEGVPSGIMEMCVDNPREGFADLFATHPAIEDRIEALVRYAGGHRIDPADLVFPPKPGEEPSRVEPPPADQPHANPWGKATELPGGIPGGLGPLAGIPPNIPGPWHTPTQSPPPASPSPVSPPPPPGPWGNRS